MMGGVRSQLNAAWTSEVVNVYRQSLSGRYPLAPGSARDATLEDFGLFFGVGGVMDNYFRKYLQPYVDTSTTPWRWQPGAAQKLGISPGVLQTFQRAAAIRDAFFRSGGTQPTVRFELKPVAMDASISQFQLELDGQQVGYDHGPSRPVAMQWPNPGSVGVVRLSISPPSASGRSGITLDGPWPGSACWSNRTWWRVTHRIVSTCGCGWTARAFPTNCARAVPSTRSRAACSAASACRSGYDDSRFLRQAGQSRRLCQPRPAAELYPALGCLVGLGLLASQQQLGADWLNVYLVSPLWRFVLAAGVCGRMRWLGC